MTVRADVVTVMLNQFENNDDSFGKLGNENYDVTICHWFFNYTFSDIKYNDRNMTKTIEITRIYVSNKVHQLDTICYRISGALTS